MISIHRGENKSGQRFQFTLRSSRVTGGYLAIVERCEEGVYRHRMAAKILDSEAAGRTWLNNQWSALGLREVPKFHPETGKLL